MEISYASVIGVVSSRCVEIKDVSTALKASLTAMYQFKCHIFILHISHILNILFDSSMEMLLVLKAFGCIQK